MQSLKPVARGVQTCAPTGCKVRSAGYEYYSLDCAIYTCILIRTASCILCTSACESTGTGSNQGRSSRSGIRAI